MKRRDSKLGNLPEELKEGLEDIAAKFGPEYLLTKLREPRPNGFDIQVSAATVYRFLRERAEAKLKANRAGIEAAVSEMASGMSRKEFRKGTMAMLQQKLYEEAVTTDNVEKMTEAYRMLSEEDARETALELEARRAAVAEENAKAARRKVELLEARSALALLPKLTEILTREGAAEGEILKEARACLLGGGGKLLAAAGNGEVPARDVGERLAQVTEEPGDWTGAFWTAGTDDGTARQ